MSTSSQTFATDEPAHRWREPSRSVATRRPSEKPNAATRPIIVTPDGRELLCESELEAKAALVLMARPDFLCIEEQPEPVHYLDEEGVRRRHTFDFRVTLTTGARIAVAVKPARIAERRRLPELLARIVRYMKPSFASGAVLVTDVQLPPHLVADARLVHDARRHADPELDRRVRGAIATLNGETAVASIVRLAGLEGHEQGFYAVARAIGDGLIVPTDRRRPVDPDTPVRRAFDWGAS